MKTTRLLTVLASTTVLASGLLTGVAMQGSASASGVTTYLYNCSQREVKPSSIVISCADANREVVNIKWKSWNSSSAAATGTLKWNDCTPTCVAGHWHAKAIAFSALDPTTVGGVRVFSELSGPAGSWGGKGKIWILQTKKLG